MKLDVGAFASTCPLLWGLGVFALAWSVMALDALGRASPLLGLISLILGALVARMYNRRTRAAAGSAAL
jgi:hypothetical protein